MMQIVNKIKSRILYQVQKILFRFSDPDYSLKEINTSYRSLELKYLHFHVFFERSLPIEFRRHRLYFKSDKRGFGEDAFHALWFLIFKEFKPKRILEIGVYRGQTLTLFGLLSDFFELNSEIHGISPFSASGDKVSKYLKDLDYLKDVIINHKEFGLKNPNLHKGFSTDMKMLQLISSLEWDLIYIDGNHDYEIVKKDFEACSRNLKVNGLIVLDDSSLFTSYKPFYFSSKGHPGPSQVANEIGNEYFEEIITVGHNRVFRKIK